MASTLYSFARIEAINNTALRKLLIGFLPSLLRTQVCAWVVLPVNSTERGLEQGDTQEPGDIYDQCQIRSEVRRVTLIPRPRSITAALKAR